MRNSLIKLAILTLPALAPVTNVHAALPPPIMDLQIFIKEGNGEIFANGKMQAAITIAYELAQGEQISNTVFRAYNSFENIADLGWTTSANDNGYKHSITTSSQQVNTSVNTEITYYLSTYSEDAQDICFAIETKSGYKLDTCKSSIYSDYVSLTPLTPVNYKAEDFNLTKLNQTNSSAETIALYGLYKNTNVSSIRTVSHTIAKPSTSYLQINSEQNAIQDYSISENTSAYTGTFILDTDISTLYTLGPGSTNNIPWNINYNGNRPIVGLLNYQLHGQRFLIDEQSCNDNSAQQGMFDCINPSVAGNGQYYTIPERNLNPLTHTSQLLTLTDEYGTESVIKLRYGSGSNNDDPYIVD